MAPTTSISRNDEFDFVIAGAGSAGCVLANRLTEDPSVRVLLLEAGVEDSHDGIEIPALFGSLFGSELDWNEALIGAHFVVQNPQAVSGCGCGVSFAVG